MSDASDRDLLVNQDDETALLSPNDIVVGQSRQLDDDPPTVVASPSVAAKTVPVARGDSLALAWESELLDRLRKAVHGQYQVVGRIGRGGMGAVYLAEDTALARQVAIKVMLPDLASGPDHAERFRREARTGASLSHPNIVPVYAVSEVDDLLYFVMKYVKGRSLDSICKESGSLPVSMVQSMLHQIGGGLAYGHRKGVVHRDMKPANVMIDGDGLAMIADFGVAKVMDAEELTMTGVTVGTPTYLSPEQCSGHAAGPASDQYALGVVAYQLLTGHPPFKSDALGALFMQHIFEQPTPLETILPSCPPPLAQSIMRMLEKKPEDRWPTIDAALEVIGGEPLGHGDPARTQIIELAKVVPPPEMFEAYGSPVSPVPTASAPGKSKSVGLVATVGFGALVLAAGIALPFTKSGGDPVATNALETPIASASANNSPSENAVAPDSAGQSGGENETNDASAQSSEPLSASTRRVTTPRPESVPQTGTVLLGTRGLAAMLYVNGESVGYISRLKSWPMPVGESEISIRVDGCAPWDSTIAVRPGTQTRIGYRNPVCSP